MDALTVIILVGVAVALFYLNKLKNSKNMIPPQKFKELLKEESGEIIDVRTKSEYNNARLKKTDYNFDISASDFEEKIETLDKDKNYFLYCRTGSRSGRASQVMKRNGFENVYNVGGLQNLVNAGFEKE
ncbi:rhodanese-like domain-containing protein [Fodinibius sp. AD559]|uniref:rhodanese-like domain-containing protein n=1 Tax=Fodinibius sp. AD559 TaxID=3424179 RepID=UPI004046D345